MTRRNHQVLLQKKGNKYQHVLITGGSVINLGSTQHSGHSDRSNLPTDKNVETVAYQAMIEPPIEKAPKQQKTSCQRSINVSVLLHLAIEVV